MRQPLVSVVIPAYNRSNTIVSCLRSVQEQTYKNWEAIVVDDGSVDTTCEEVERLAREDNRIRMIRHESNKGAQAARNSGIYAARGEWIAFLDSDDQFLPNSIESRLHVAMEQKVAVVHSSAFIVEEDGSKRKYNVPPMTGYVYKALLEREGPVFPGLLVLKEALKRIEFLDENIVAFQEWDTAIRLARFYPFGFQPEPTFIWDCRYPDTISKDFIRNGKGYEQVFLKHFWAILRYLGPSALARHYRLAARWYQRGGDMQSERRCNLKAFIWSSVDPRTAVSRIKRLLKVKV